MQTVRRDGVKQIKLVVTMDVIGPLQRDVTVEHEGQVVARAIEFEDDHPTAQPDDRAWKVVFAHPQDGETPLGVGGSTLTRATGEAVFAGWILAGLKGLEKGATE